MHSDLKPFKFLEIVGEIIGHNKMDLQGLPIGTTIESNGGLKIHSGRHIALNLEVVEHLFDLWVRQIIVQPFRLL